MSSLCFVKAAVADWGEIERPAIRYDDDALLLAPAATTLDTVQLQRDWMIAAVKKQQQQQQQEQRKKKQKKKKKRPRRVEDDDDEEEEEEELIIMRIFDHRGDRIGLVRPPKKRQKKETNANNEHNPNANNNVVQIYNDFYAHYLMHASSSSSSSSDRWDLPSLARAQSVYENHHHLYPNYASTTASSTFVVAGGGSETVLGGIGSSALPPPDEVAAATTTPDNDDDDDDDDEAEAAKIFPETTTADHVNNDDQDRCCSQPEGMVENVAAESLSSSPSSSDSCDDDDDGSSRTKIASATRLHNNHNSPPHETGAAVKNYDDDSSIPDDDEDDNEEEEEDHFVPIRIDPDDSVATVMQKYEASGLWQRRAHPEHLHQTWVHRIGRRNSRNNNNHRHDHNNEAYDSVASFLQLVVAREQPHWQWPKDEMASAGTASPSSTTSASSSEESEPEVHHHHQEKHKVKTKPVKRHMPAPTSKTPNKKATVANRPAKKYKIRANPTSSRTTASHSTASTMTPATTTKKKKIATGTIASLPARVQDALRNIGVVFHQEETNKNGSCYFTKFPDRVFQSIHGLARFIVQYGCPAPPRRPKAVDVKILDQWIVSQFKAQRQSSTGVGNKKKVLDFAKIQVLLTNPKHGIRFEILDGKLYDPYRINKAVANCRDDVDRFLPHDYRRLANCILRHQKERLADHQPDVMVWCYRHAGLQVWQSKREVPADDDWSLYQNQMAAEDRSSSVGTTSSSPGDSSSSSCSSMEEVVPTAKPRSVVRNNTKDGRYYWQTADLPSDKTIIPILRKLDIIASDDDDYTVTLFQKSNVRLPLSMARQVFCRFGIPWNNSVGTLPTDDELETLRRWIVFANIGIPSRGSQKVLKLVHAVSGDKLQKELIKLGFYFELGKKIYVPRYRSLESAPNEYGQKFQHGRHFFHTTELTTLVRSYVRTRPAIMAKTSMEVRLWASVASDAKIECMTDDLDQDYEFQQFVGAMREDQSNVSDTDTTMVHDITPAKPSKTIPKVQDSDWTSTDDSTPSSPDSRTSRDSSDSEHVVDWYKKTGKIPLFKQIYPLLQKIGFGWQSGFIFHRGCDDTITFETNLDIAKYVLQNGIPRADKLSAEEQQEVTRWATFAFVDVPMSNSGKVLRRVQPPTTKNATHRLLQRFGFTVRGDTIFPPGATGHDNGQEYLLEQIRVFIRCRVEDEFNVMPLQERPRASRKAVPVAEEERLALRLWAATAPDALPIYDAGGEYDAYESSPPDDAFGAGVAPKSDANERFAPDDVAGTDSIKHTFKAIIGDTAASMEDSNVVDTMLEPALQEVEHCTANPAEVRDLTNANWPSASVTDNLTREQTATLPLDQSTREVNHDTAEDFGTNATDATTNIGETRMVEDETIESVLQTEEEESNGVCARAIVDQEMADSTRMSNGRLADYLTQEQEEKEEVPLDKSTHENRLPCRTMMTKEVSLKASANDEIDGHSKLGHFNPLLEPALLQEEVNVANTTICAVVADQATICGDGAAAALNEPPSLAVDTGRRAEVADDGLYLTQQEEVEAVPRFADETDHDLDEILAPLDGEDADADDVDDRLGGSDGKYSPNGYNCDEHVRHHLADHAMQTQADCDDDDDDNNNDTNLIVGSSFDHDEDNTNMRCGGNYGRVTTTTTLSSSSDSLIYQPKDYSATTAARGRSSLPPTRKKNEVDEDTETAGAMCSDMDMLEDDNDNNGPDDRGDTREERGFVYLTQQQDETEEDDDNNEKARAAALLLESSTTQEELSSTGTLRKMSFSTATP